MAFKLIYDLDNGEDKVVFPQTFDTKRDALGKILQDLTSELAKACAFACEKYDSAPDWLVRTALQTKAQKTAMDIMATIEQAWSLDDGFQLPVPWKGGFYVIVERD